MDTLIVVDKNDNEIGFEEKEKAHQGKLPLHRAFSIFIFNFRGEMLIQKRSSKKKTWPGFWANACCSHPRKGEAVEESAKRRLKEELGFSTPLKFLFKFQYKAQFDKIWGEHELDHVFVGKYDGPVKPDRNEIEDWKFIDVSELIEDAKQDGKYSPWFKLCFKRVIAEMKGQ